MICKYCIITSHKISKVGEYIIVEFPNVSTLCNKDCLVLKINQNIEVDSYNTKVKFKLNGKIFDALTYNGNFVRVNQLSNKKVYPVRISTENPVMIIKCYLPPSGIEYPKVEVKEKVV